VTAHRWSCTPLAAAWSIRTLPHQG